MTKSEIDIIKGAIFQMATSLQKIVEAIDTQSRAFYTLKEMCDFAPHALNVCGYLGELYANSDPFAAAVAALNMAEPTGIDVPFDDLIRAAIVAVNDAIIKAQGVRSDFLEDCHAVGHASGHRHNTMSPAEKECLN